MTLVDELLAGLVALDSAALRRTVADRRALHVEALSASLGRLGAADLVAARTGKPFGESAVKNAVTRARQVRADPDRLAAAEAFGGPIPTVSTDRRASWPRTL